MDITEKLRSGNFGWAPELNVPAADEIDRLRAEVAAKDAEIARLREALAPFAAYPLEEFGKENSRPEQPLFGANDWRLTVGDVRKARAALAPVEVAK